MQKTTIGKVYLLLLFLLLQFSYEYAAGLSRDSLENAIQAYEEEPDSVRAYIQSLVI